jgi:hypothetical protein
VERLRGHRDTLKVQKQDLESKIKRAEPKKVQSDLTEKTVELEATKLAVKDMDDYHTALDQALMKSETKKWGVFFDWFVFVTDITRKRWRRSTALFASCGRRRTR